MVVVIFSSVQSLSHVQLFATPWTAAYQASLSITNSWSLHTLMSIESVMPSNHLILCGPLLLLPPIPLSIRSFPMSQFFSWGSQSTGVSALASVLPKNTQGWFPSEWTAWISLQFKGLWRVFSNTTVQCSAFFMVPLTSIHDYWKTIALTRQMFVGKVMSLLFNKLSRFVIAFLPRSKHLFFLFLIGG